jgi:hypothetical protein
VTTPAEEARLLEAAENLAAAVDAALPGWVERSVRRFAPGADAGTIDAAGREAVEDVGASVRSLLSQDVEAQTANPLALLRRAVRYPTEVLAAAGVAPVDRSEFDRQAFPDDPYGLTPATWSDIDPALHDPGLVWGAAKAYVLLNRRR